VVEVEREHGHRLAGPVGLGEHAAQGVGDRAAVGEARERSVDARSSAIARLRMLAMTGAAWVTVSSTWMRSSSSSGA
jgi:hypothetical protein